MASARVWGHFSETCAAKVWAFLSPFMNIQMVAALLLKLYLFAPLLNLCIYAAKDSLSFCWISMKQLTDMWMSKITNF